MATKKLNLTIQLKRGTTEEWEQYGTVVPAVGEPCLDLTTGHLRFGDGETSYKDLPDTDDVLQRNIENLFKLVGDENSGLTKDLSDLRLYVGVLPPLHSATDVVGYILETREDLFNYIDESQEAEHQNKAVLDSITQADVDQWDAAQANVIESIQVNGSAVPVSGKTANITITTPEGGTPLPDVTAADNGKFLRVINGAWVADMLTDVSREGM